MKYNFDEVVSREGSNAIKTDALFVKNYLKQEINEDTICLWVADMDFACSLPIIEAIKARADQRIFGYTQVNSDEEYFEAIMSYFKRNYDVDYKRESIVYSPGTVSALDNLVKSLTNIGDGIIIQKPVYYPFSMVINQNDRTLLNNQLINNNGRYEIDFDNFEELAKEAKMFILCNPHNPVGRIWDEEELQKLITICQENDVIIVSDEIHADIRRVGQTFTPIQTLTESDEVITCTAINKAFNTAGLHCSNIIINNKKYRKKFIKEMGMVSPSPFAIPVLKAAYNESEDWLKQMNEYLDENFLFVKNFLNTHLPKVTFKVAEGTYLGWMDFNAFEMTKEELEEKFIKEANVLIEHGEMFGEDEGKGFVRINLSTPRSVLLEAMKRIEKAFRGL